MNMGTICGCRGDIVGSLNANIHGNGTQSLILAHGFGTDQTVWHYLVPFLACYFKVVVFDLAFSPNVIPHVYNPCKYASFDAYAEDLLCVIDQLQLNNNIYIGHSMSAMIGCVAATKRPDLFDHLVLLSGSPRYLNETGYNGGFNRSELNTIFDEISQNFSGWVKSFAPTAVGVKNKAAIAEFENTLGRMKPSVARSVAKTVFLSDLRRILPQLAVPCTIIQSRKDSIVPVPVAFYMKERIGSHTKVKILRTEGHFPQLTAYHLLLKALRTTLHL